ncbi:MAG: DUF1501 domain-containing protein [Acidimicrobiales bacterium]
MFSVELGGFDTHTNQIDPQAVLLPQLDTAVGAFLDAISHTKRGRDTVVVYTEFGRRVAPNASAGTDHGRANPQRRLRALPGHHAPRMLAPRLPPSALHLHPPTSGRS